MVDIAVSFDKEQRLLNNSYYRSLEQLKDEIRREFELDQSDFAVKFLQANGEPLELSDLNYDQIIGPSFR